MALPLLAIASGALKVGKKLFGGIKARRQKKKDKQAAKNEKIDAKLAAAEAQLNSLGIGTGASTVSQAGNSLALFKDLKAEEREDGFAGSFAGDVRGEGGQRPPMPEYVKWGGIALGALVLLKVLKIIK